MSIFDQKASTWDTPDKITRAQKFANKIIEESKNLTDISALEFGAGTGLVSFCMSNNLKQITLLDTSTGMLEEAQKKITDNNTHHISVLNLDLTKDVFNENFDLIYSLLTLHHIPDTKDILKKFYKLLNTNGKLIIADLDSENGEFHGDGFDGHNGFDRSYLISLAQEIGYTDVRVETLTEINRADLNKIYPVFVLTATKSS